MSKDSAHSPGKSLCVLTFFWGSADAPIQSLGKLEDGGVWWLLPHRTFVHGAHCTKWFSTRGVDIGLFPCCLLHCSWSHWEKLSIDLFAIYRVKKKSMLLVKTVKKLPKNSIIFACVSSVRYMSFVFSPFQQKKMKINLDPCLGVDGRIVWDNIKIWRRTMHCDATTNKLKSK